MREGGARLVAAGRRQGPGARPDTSHRRERRAPLVVTTGPTTSTANRKARRTNSATRGARRGTSGRPEGSRTRDLNERPRSPVKTTMKLELEIVSYS